MKKIKTISARARQFDVQLTGIQRKSYWNRWLKTFHQSLLLMLMCVFSPVALSEQIKGTGTILPAILIKSWGEAYTKHHPAVEVKYKGVNSNEGMEALLKEEIDFALLDMPLSKDALNEKGLIQFPIALAAVTPIVNIPGVHMGQLNLTGKVIGDIFLGNITSWRDPVIAEMNPKLNLPDEPIIVVHRSAPPGVKTIMGDYIAKNNEQWKSLKGSTMPGNWPATAIEVKTPKESFEVMKANTYSIGYASLPFSIKSGFPYVRLRNPAGFFVSPSDENVIAASINAKWNIHSDFNEILSDQPGADSWPMTNTSFVIIRKVSKNAVQTNLLLKFFRSSMKNGALNAVASDYVPLPQEVVKQVIESWKAVVDINGHPVYNP